jgi:hypothetical protein
MKGGCNVFKNKFLRKISHLQKLIELLFNEKSELFEVLLLELQIENILTF